MACGASEKWLTGRHRPLISGAWLAQPARDMATSSNGNRKWDAGFTLHQSTRFKENGWEEGARHAPTRGLRYQGRGRDGMSGWIRGRDDSAQMHALALENGSYRRRTSPDRRKRRNRRKPVPRGRTFLSSSQSASLRPQCWPLSRMQPRMNKNYPGYERRSRVRVPRITLSKR